jgi:hypothetical protein
MRCYWEAIGILGPIYGLIGKDLSEREIARKLNLPETTVNACTAWLMHFLKCDNRAQSRIAPDPVLVPEETALPLASSQNGRG